MSDARRSPDAEEFYIGYLPRAPRALGRAARRRASALVAAALAAGALLSNRQGDPGPGRYELGRPRTFEGRVELEPVPQLVVARPGASDRPSRYLLTVPGKHSALEAVRAFAGRSVELSGRLVYRGEATMVEVEPGSLRALAGGAPDAAGDIGGAEDLGTTTLAGEIVDAKCYLGVMKPGNLKPHRGCAARCIAGGVPAVLLVRGPLGTTHTVLLASADGGLVNDQVADLVAEPVEITGRLLRYDDLFVLRADPKTYRRLP